MKRTVLTVICLLVAVAAWSQSGGEFQKWMQTVGATCGSLKKNLDSKNGDAAAADARKLHTVFGEVHAFFHEKNSSDAMKYAMEASHGFEKVAEQASAGRLDEASASFRAATANCGGCHSAHREKAPDGSYKIKY
jgi:cytochrome c553